MNLSGTLNAFKVLFSPSLCLPHHTVATFNQLPVPLSNAFKDKNGEKGPDIRAVILDKDNCFAVPHADEIHEPYKVISTSMIRVQDVETNSRRTNSKNFERPIRARGS